MASPRDLPALGETKACPKCGEQRSPILGEQMDRFYLHFCRSLVSLYGERPSGYPCAVPELRLDDEHLDVACSRCGFLFAERCADSGSAA